MFSASGSGRPINIHSVGRLARRLSKQESVAVREPWGEIETETETSVASPVQESPVAKDVSRVTTNESTTPSSSGYTYETAAVEQVPLTSPTSPLLAHGTVDNNASDDSDDDYDDDDTDFLSRHYVSRAQNAVASRDYPSAETLYAKALSIAIARRTRMNGSTSKNSTESHNYPASSFDCVNLCLLVCRMRSLQGKHEEAGMNLSQACGYVHKNDGDLAKGLRALIDLEAAAYFTRQKKYDKADKCCSEGLRAARKLMKAGKKGARGGSKENMKEQQMEGRYEDLYEDFLRAKSAILNLRGDHVEAEAYDALLRERKQGRGGGEGEKTTQDTDNGAFDDILEGLHRDKKEKEEEVAVSTAPTAARNETMPVKQKYRQPTEDEAKDIRASIGSQQIHILARYFSDSPDNQPIDINYKYSSSSGDTFLHDAVRCAAGRALNLDTDAHTDVIYYLFNLKNADATITNKGGYIPAEFLLPSYKQIGVCRSVEHERKRDNNFCRIAQALYFAKNTPAMDINKPLKGGYGYLSAPWLHRSLEFHLERFSLLLMDLGADINAVYEGHTPIKIAAQHNLALPFYELAYKRGVSYDKNDITAAMICHALERSQIEPALWLLSENNKAANGTSNYEEGRGGDTPLHIALRLKQFDMIRALLRAGADGNAKDWKGEPAYQVIRGWTETERKREKITEVDLRNDLMELPFENDYILRRY